jgi:hypothetical protein
MQVSLLNLHLAAKLVLEESKFLKCRHRFNPRGLLAAPTLYSEEKLAPVFRKFP